METLPYDKLNKEQYRWIDGVESVQTSAGRVRLSAGESEITVSAGRAELLVPMFREPCSVASFLDSLPDSEDRTRWRHLLRELFQIRLLVQTTTASDRKRTPIVKRLNRASDRMVYVMTGAAGAMGRIGPKRIDALEFLREGRLFDQNFVVFRDPNKKRYFDGVSDEIPSFGALIEWQKKMRSEASHVRHLSCMGNSMGAGTAIMCGYYLKADTVHAFAPGWIRFNDGIDADDGHIWDLPKLLSKSNGVTEYHIYFSFFNPRDRRNAWALKGLPGVRIHPALTRDHNTMSRLIRKGKLARVLQTREKAP